MTEFLMTFLLNAFWQIALIILATMIGTWLLRDAGSGSKHVVWVAALVLSLTLPLLTAMWFNAPDITARAETTAVSQIHFEQVGRVVFEPSLSEAPVATAIPATIPISAGLAFGILALYGLFVIYRAGALVNALLRTTAIRRRAKASELPENILAAIAQCSDVITDRQISVLFSSEVTVPVTVGWLRPVIILPERFLRETDANVLTTAIAHEMVHVARRDYAVNLFLEAFSLPISFHPAVAYAKRRIAQMRELCCDEIVATRLLNADIYARSLLNIAGSASLQNRLSPMITVGITDNRNLEVRIMSLLKRSKMSRFKKGLLALAALAVLAVPLVVAAYLSPDVTITSAAVQPEAQPTVPEKVENEQVRAVREELEVELAAIKMRQQRPDLTEEERAKLGQRAKIIQEKLEALTKVPDDREPIERVEAKLEWLKAALKDPKVNDVDGAKIKHDIETLERELAERQLMETDQSMRRERLRSELRKVAETLQDASLNEAQKYELRAMEAKLRSDLHLLETGKLAPIFGGARISKDDDAGWDFPPDMDADMDTPRSRQAMEKLKKSANITTEQAMELALASYPGKLIEKSLGQIKGEVVYRFFIIDAAATPDSNALAVHVSGIDGRIIKTTRAQVTTYFKPNNERVTFFKRSKPKPE